MPASRSAIARASRWLARGAAAGAVGALVAGAVEAGLRVEGGREQLVSAGYAVLGLWPVMTLAVMMMRAGWAGWRPALAAMTATATATTTTTATTTATTAAPPASPAPPSLAPLFAWGAVAFLSILALAAAAWFTVSWAALFTAFHARTLAALLPLTIAVTAALLFLAAYPAARLATSLFSSLDARWRARRRRPLLTRRRFAAAAAVVAAATALLLLRFLRRQLALPALAPVLGPQLTLLLAPVVAALAALAWHAATCRVQAARRAAPLLIAPLVLAAAAVATAVSFRFTRPALLLDVWSRPTFASAVLERTHSLEALRGDISPAAAALTPLPGARHPDVILITLDTVRADRTPPLLATTELPALSSLVARGAAFTRAYAPGNVTRRSLPSLVTGLSATRVRGRMSGWALRLDPRHVLLAERFAAAGYETAGFLCCEHFWGPKRKLGWSRGLQTLRLIEDGEALAEQARAWLTERAKALRYQQPGARRPLFLWMHFMEPHKWNGTSTLLPAPENILPRYDSVIRRVDAMLATVLRGLDASDEQPIIAVTADHGEGLGEHATPFHSTNLYESLLRVPLIITGPGIEPLQSSEVVGLIDVVPTLIELAGFALPKGNQLEGRSLALLLRGQRPSDEEGGLAYAAMVPDQAVSERREALIRGRWKLITNDRRGPGANGGAAGVELYDLKADPGETTNLAGSAPEFNELMRLLEAQRALERQSPFAPLAQ